MDKKGCRARIIEKKNNEPSPVNVTYPQVVGLESAEVEDRINASIEGIVRKLIASQLEPSPPSPDFNLSTFEGNYKVTANKNCVLSLRFQDYFYWTGAAHGLTMVESLSFDLRTGKVYALKDLFFPNSLYRVKINNLIKQQIKEQDIPLLSEFSGIDDYQNFFLTESDLVIYYQLYDLAPYAWGIPEFKIPLKYLKDLSKEGGPILELLKSRI